MMKEKSLFLSERLFEQIQELKSPESSLRGLGIKQMSTYNTTNRLLTINPSLSNRSRYMPGLMWLM
jgi:hypothetical protein